MNPLSWGARVGDEIRSGYINRAFSGVPNEGMKSKVATQILPSWGGQRKCPQKTEHFECQHIGCPVLPAPSHGAPKFSNACNASQFLHIGLCYGGDLFNILDRRLGGDGGGGSRIALGHPPWSSLSPLHLPCCHSGFHASCGCMSQMAHHRRSPSGQLDN